MGLITVKLKNGLTISRHLFYQGVWFWIIHKKGKIIEMLPTSLAEEKYKVSLSD